LLFFFTFLSICFCSRDFCLPLQARARPFFSPNVEKTRSPFFSEMVFGRMVSPARTPVFACSGEKTSHARDELSYPQDGPAQFIFFSWRGFCSCFIFFLCDTLSNISISSRRGGSDCNCSKSKRPFISDGYPSY